MHGEIDQALMPLLRSAAAVFAGLGFMFSAVLIGTGLIGALLLAGGMVRAYIAASLVLSTLAAIFGGWLTARIAGQAEMRHAAVLAAIMATMTLSIVLGERPEGQPAWYAPVVGGLGVAGVLAGGWLRASAAEAVQGEA